MQDLFGTDPKFGNASECVALGYEDALKNLRELAQLALEEKVDRPLSECSGLWIAYSDVGAGRKIELRYERYDRDSDNKSSFTISIGKDPYNPTANEIKFFLPNSTEHGSHWHRYSGHENRGNRWRPNEEDLQIIERAIRDFRSGKLADR